MPGGKRKLCWRDVMKPRLMRDALGWGFVFYSKNNEIVMTTIELYGRIRNWLRLYDRPPFPLSSDKEEFHIKVSLIRKWKCEILADVTEFKVPMELKGTVVEQDLLMAIFYALAGDYGRIKEIHGLLSNVQKYLVENQLCTNNYSQN
jgi:hypothetical protein